MLEGYEVTLPDGSVGSLADFYAGIMDESIQATDAGYVLSDGTLVPTQGEAMWNPDADVLIALMSQSINVEQGDDTPEIVEGAGLAPHDANYWIKKIFIDNSVLFAGGVAAYFLHKKDTKKALTYGVGILVAAEVYKYAVISG